MAGSNELTAGVVPTHVGHPICCEALRRRGQDTLGSEQAEILRTLCSEGAKSDRSSKYLHSLEQPVSSPARKAEYIREVPDGE